MVDDRLTMTKHHAAGNDFLVLLDPDDDRPLDRAVVRALCDRHRGIGADGVLRLSRTGRQPDSPARGSGSPSLGMELRNADGSAAEMSGNGIRCLVQAAVEAGWAEPPIVEVMTAAGPRRVEYERRSPVDGWGGVGMGRARPGATRPLGPPALRALEVDIGNPHLVVLVEDPWELGLEELATAYAGSPVDRNVELVAVADRSSLVLRVHERGVGPTLACGTGTCAAVAAARIWGLVDRRVAVRNPGGTLEVMVPEDPDGELVLSGPVRRVAEVSVVPGALGVELVSAVPTGSGEWRS